MGACIERRSVTSHGVKSSSDIKMLHRNREFLKEAEKPAEQLKPVKNESQPLKHNFKLSSPEPKLISTPKSVPVKKTRTRVVKLTTMFLQWRRSKSNFCKVCSPFGISKCGWLR